MDKLQLKVILDLKNKLSAPLKSIQQRTQEASNALKKAREQLKSLESVQKQVGAFRELKQGLVGSQQQLSQTQHKLSVLSRAMRQMSTPSRAMQAEFDKTAQKARILSERIKTDQTRLQGLRTQLNSASISTRNLGTANATLNRKISGANNEINKQTEALRKQSAAARKSAAIQQKFKAKAAKGGMIAGAGVGAAYAGMKAGGMLARVLKTGMDFDQSMSELQAITRIEDKNDSRMVKLREQARTLPLSTKFTDLEVAEGQYFLARTGFSADQVLKAMPGLLDLTAAGGKKLSLGETADIASNIQTAMGIPAEEMGRVADVLAAAFTRNNVDIPMLGESLKYSAGIGKMFGQSLESVTAMTAVMGNAGIQGSQAGTSLRQILTRIGSSQDVKKLGVKTTDDKGNMRQINDILVDIYKATEGMGNVQRGNILKKISGQIGVTAFGKIIDSAGSGENAELLKILQNSQGTAARVAKTGLDNAAGDLTILHAALENISITLFQDNDSWLRALIQNLSKFLHHVGEFLKEYPMISKALVVGIGAFSALSTVIGGLLVPVGLIYAKFALIRFVFAKLGVSTGLFTGVLKTLGMAFTWLRGIVLALGRAMLANPIISAVTLIGTAVYLIYEYWTPIKSFFADLWGGVTQIFSNVWQTIKTAFEGGIGGVSALIINWSPLGLFYQAFAGVLSWFGIDLPDKFTEFGANIINGIINGITSMLGALKDSVMGAASSAYDWFKEKLGIASPSRVFMEAGGFISEGLAQGIEQTMGMVRIASDKLSDMGMAGLAGLSPLAPAGMSPISFTDTPLSRPAIPSRASGNTLAGDTINVTINVTSGNPQDIAQAVQRALTEHSRNKQARLRSSLSDYE